MQRPRFCVWCSGEALPGLSICDVCQMALVKYPDQNDVIFRAYYDIGHDEIAAFLNGHAAFQRWLIEHPTKEGA